MDENRVDPQSLVDDAGNVRPAVELESRLRREAADHADAMGMTPRAARGSG